MSRISQAKNSTALIGIEGGATRTVAVSADGKRSSRVESGPANMRLLSDAALVRHFSGLAKSLPPPRALAIGLAGARTETDRARIRRAAGRVWPGTPCYATNDLETALAAVKQRPRKRALPRVLVLSGTGSCCYGETLDGRAVKVGGWGHILGDKGSGYEIGLRALKATVYYYDRDGIWPRLGSSLLRALQLNEPEALVGWAGVAGKAEIAALAVEVFDAWNRRDRIAADIVTAAASTLARDATSCARRLVGEGEQVQFVLAGSVLLKQPRFARQVARRLRQLWPHAVVTPLNRESVWGAVELARKHFGPELNPREAEPEGETAQDGALPSPIPGALSTTEQRNRRSLNFDKLPLAKAIALMLREDAGLPAAIWAEHAKIERVIRCIARAWRSGGRLFYVGAGTSGRLGVLDASECPPTFSTPPDWVQGIIAGGQTALWNSIEGAEDDRDSGARAIRFRGVQRADVVVGIAASGRTPFVWGALAEAKARGAATVLLCFNPRLEVARGERPTILIAPAIGPEVLTGSTRLKAGTATKMILNMFTTLAMVRIGKVVSNLMVDVRPSNAKLRDRATRIVGELTGANYEEAWTALERANWEVKAACVRLKRRKARAVC